MPKVTDEYRAARRDEITAAALRCFATRGFAGTSMSDIIEESGLSAGAIYGHFESKHQIMQSVAKQVVRNRLDGLRDFVADGPLPSPGEVVAYLLPVTTSDDARPSLLVQVWGQSMVEDGMREMLGGVFSDLQETYRGHFDAWARIHKDFDDDARSLWVDDLVRIALGLGQGYIVQAAVLPDFDGDRYLASVRTLLAR